MQLSIELSFYPLKDEYKQAILNLIGELRKESDIIVLSNRMSTQLFGEYDSLMVVLTRLMKESFERHGAAVFVTKFIHSDRQPKP